MSRILKDKTNQITQKYSKTHCGIDVVGKEGLPEIIAHSDGEVYAISDGMDTKIGASGVASYGNYVQIKHPNNMFTLYAHLKKGLKVKKGDKVVRGQVLGTMGNSGNSYGTHLHFEVRNKDNYVIDPEPYINADLPNLSTLPEPQPRDENAYQVNILINNLRARVNFGLDKAILGFVKSGIYQIYEEQEKDGYKWLKIADNVWLAFSEEWAELYFKKDYKKLYEEELETNKLLEDKINKVKEILG